MKTGTFPLRSRRSPPPASTQPEDVEEALKVVQSLDPAGVGARNLRECLLLQIESLNGKGGVAWQIVSHHMRLLETRQYKELARLLARPMEHIEIAVNMIHHLNPRPGLRYSGAGARVVEPDVYFIKDGDDYIIQMNDEDVPQLRLNAQYRSMLDRDNGATKEVRDYVRERYTSAIQLMKNIEQRKQTIMKVCQAIVRRQIDFLAHGLDSLKPMMIKEVAEEVGVHPSTVSRAVASKYVHTPQGVFELRYFFSEAVQGPSGGATPLLLLKRMVKKMIEEEDRSQTADRRADHRAAADPGDQRHPPHRRQVPRGHEDPVHAPAPRPQLTAGAMTRAYLYARFGAPMWGRMVSCGRVVLGLVGICILVGRPSATRPQVANLPHITRADLLLCRAPPAALPPADAL